ncbi:MAG TPA: ABC transporter ATP-binding protein [Opitutaceae bacterium]|nr:ABC transporter ATP-binding protein [Opitutaceae bacterium]
MADASECDAHILSSSSRAAIGDADFSKFGRPHCPPNLGIHTIKTQLAPHLPGLRLGPMIEVSGLTKSYGDFVAVRDLSFFVRTGNIMGLVGPNGAGKTTTLRCLTGIIPPTMGRILLNGVDLASEPVKAKRQLAFFPDEPRLFDNLSLWQHLVFTARLYQVSNYEARAEALLQKLEIADKRKLMPSELSRGMKQKLTLACGLLHEPKVIFFDEPLTGLDPGGIRSMKETIRQLGRDGAAIIISSHLLSLLEEVCSHVLILKDGVKVADGEINEVRRRFGAEGDTSLEDVFFRATDTTPPPLPNASNEPPPAPREAGADAPRV